MSLPPDCGGYGRPGQRSNRYQWRWLELGARPLARDLNFAGPPGFLPRRGGNLRAFAEAACFLGDSPRPSSSQDKLFDTVWTATEMLDRLALITSEAFMAAREELISRQQQELLELSTPVVKLWDGILALPIIGTLDSARTQVVMESLLQTVVSTNSKFAIIDITGVPTVDTLVAQHLLKTITAARLMGAECIISGVRPQIAQTIVNLGINLEDVVTKAKLSDAFALALQRSGRKVVREASAPLSPISGLFTRREE
jgi:rsbT co-antagonist protein RsbR